MDNAKREVLEDRLRGKERLLAEAKTQLEFLTGRLTGEPWSAEFAHAVDEQKYLIESLEFDIKNLKAQLR